MIRRLAMICYLILLAASVMACDAFGTPSPSPFAPEDLAATLPRVVAGAEVRVRNLSPAEVTRAFIQRSEKLRSEMAGWERGPSDVLGATASITRGSAVSSVMALRVKGVLAEELVWAMVELAGRQEVGLQLVLIGGKGLDFQYPGDLGFLLRDVGEVIYLVHATDQATAEAIIAALP